MRNMLVHYIITINDLARMLKYRMLDHDLSIDLKVVIYAEGRSYKARHARTRLATSHGARAD